METTRQHPFFVQGRGFTPAGELATGDCFELASGEAGVVLGTSREATAGRIPTYNIEVADYSTYFVGESGVWVHNMSREFCEDINTRIEKVRRELKKIGKWSGKTTESIPGREFEVMEEAIQAHRSEGALFFAEDGNLFLHDTCLDANAEFAKLSELQAAADYEKYIRNHESFTAQRQYFLGKAGNFEIHHMVEKRISTAFGIPPHVHPKGPTIVLPENPHSIPGGLTLEEYSRYKRIYKREPIYHQKDLVQDIGKIFTDLGFPPATRLSLANADLLVSALKILYTNEKYIHLNMWPATREFLKKAGVAIPTP